MDTTNLKEQDSGKKTHRTEMVTKGILSPKRAEETTRTNQSDGNKTITRSITKGIFLPSAHVWRLRRYGELYREWVLTRNTRFLEYIPLLAYDLRRNWAWKDRELTEEREQAHKWAAALGVAPDQPDMQILKFVCEYALMANRAGDRE